MRPSSHKASALPLATGKADVYIGGEVVAHLFTEKGHAHRNIVATAARLLQPRISWGGGNSPTAGTKTTGSDQSYEPIWQLDAPQQNNFPSWQVVCM